MNWMVGMALGLIVVLILWRLTSWHEHKYAAKSQEVIQRKLDQIEAAKRKGKQ
jgi:hypothetical protein